MIWAILLFCAPAVLVRLTADWRHRRNASFIGVVTLIVGIIGGLIPSLVVSIACMVLCVFGILAPTILVKQALRAARGARFKRAYFLIYPLCLFDKRWTYFKQVCQVLALDTEHTMARLNEISALVKSENEARADLAYQLILLHRQDWSDLQYSPNVSLRVQALCELGRVAEAVELAGVSWHRRVSLQTLLNRRHLACSILAYSGRLTDLEHAMALTACSNADAERWRCAAQTHHHALPTGARAVHTDRANDDAATQGVTVAMHDEPISTHVVSDPIQTEIVDRISREIGAMFNLRLAPPWSSWSVVLIGTILLLGFLYQSWHGATDDARIAYQLGALLPDGTLPSDLRRLLSYGYLHAGWAHLASNLVLLAIFGPIVARELTNVGLLVLWFSGAMIAGMGISWLGGRGVTIGASGAAMTLYGYLTVAIVTNHRLGKTRWGHLVARILIFAFVAEALVDLYIPLISSAGHFVGFTWGGIIAIVVHLPDHGPRIHPPI